MTASPRLASGERERERERKALRAFSLSPLPPNLHTSISFPFSLLFFIIHSFRVRTSSGMFLLRGQDAVVAAIEARIAAHAHIPATHGESIQVLHYAPGELYEPHFDSFHEEFNQRNGGQRIATLLMYLTDVEEGGETVFPSSTDKPQAGAAAGAVSECARAGVAVPPRAGDALLFYSLTPDGRVDPKSLHGGCPVLRGDKWSATKWMRVGPFDSA